MDQSSQDEEQCNFHCYYDAPLPLDEVIQVQYPKSDFMGIECLEGSQAVTFAWLQKL